MKSQNLDYQNLEFTIDSVIEPRKTFVLRWLNQIGEIIVKVLTTDGQPKVYMKRNSLGEAYWQVYDPRTCHSVYLGSEQEVRIWLDKRFYR